MVSTRLCMQHDFDLLIALFDLNNVIANVELYNTIERPN